ncbi:MAG: T9SS type A sorting domain-containing protein, partial [Chitinophagaceae bacterium]|nr:T9SS type A sorting domain-containing protein [Chitinophagaceae bacterium]
MKPNFFLKTLLPVFLIILINLTEAGAQCNLAPSQFPVVPSCTNPVLYANFTSQYNPAAGNAFMICNSNPWGALIYDTMMNDVFGAPNWTKLTYANANPATIFQPSTQFVYIEGSDAANPAAQTAYLAANMPAIEAWVNAGGRLFLNRAPNVALDTTDFGFGGVMNITSILMNYANVVPGHPIGIGQFSPSGYGPFTGNYFAQARIAGGATSPIITGNLNDLVTEKIWGNGLVIFGGITSPNWHQPALNAKNLYRNLLDYAANSQQGPPVTYLWQPGGAATSTITANATGIYTITATQGPCTTTATISVTVHIPIIPNVTTGAGTITANAGGGLAPFEYSLNGAAFSPNNTFTYLCSGTYTLTVKDSYAGGCLKDTVITIAAANNFPGGTVTPFIVDASCALSGDGMISLIVTPANTYQFLWSNGETTSSIDSLNAGLYTVKITNGNNECVENSYTVNATANNCGNIVGNVYYDSNYNCVQDISEFNIPNTLLISNPGNHMAFTDAMGNYQFNGLPYGTYTVTHQNNLNSYSTHCGNNILSTINNLNPNQTIVFGDTSRGIDFAVWSSGGCFQLPDLNKHKNIGYSHDVPNPGINSNVGTIYAVFDSINHYLSSIPTHTSISGDTVFWNVNNIAYGNHYIDVAFTFPLNYTVANICPFHVGITNTLLPDTNVANNLVNYTFSFCNGYDPNNKNVAPKGEGPAGNIDAYDPLTKLMTYDINFQNTGNAPAYNIVVEDTISDKLDITTFQVVDASHNYQIEVVNNNIIKWKFYNIMLPDSNTNEPASHGHIVYQIRQKNANTVGDVIKNKAYIYFDFNPAIVTNETVNTLVMPEGVKDLNADNQIVIYPNPASDVVYIESENAVTEVVIYDMQLNRIQNLSVPKNKTAVLNTKSFSNGMYFIKTN